MIPVEITLSRCILITIYCAVGIAFPNNFWAMIWLHEPMGQKREAALETGDKYLFSHWPPCKICSGADRSKLHF